MLCAVTGQLKPKERLIEPRWMDLDLVFPNGVGRYQESAKVWAEFQRLRDQAGVPRVRFHDLRHTAATLMLGRGIHPKIASEMLGHSTVGITLDLYSHLRETMRRDAAESIDRILWNRA